MQKGAFEKALKEYAKLLKSDPKDTNVRLKIGDLHLKRGDSNRAIEAYGQVAEIFSKEGFDAKAVAIYKQILRIDGTSLDARIRLGELYQRLGLAPDALREFQEGVKLCRDRGQKREAFELLKRAASLDPTNVPNRLSLADLLLREGMKAEAQQEYESLLTEVERESNHEDVVRVCEQALESFPELVRALQALVKAKVLLGTSEEAIEPLRKILPKLPDDIPVREALVSAYEANGDAQAAQSLYREIAELYRKRGDDDRAREILQRFVPVEPFVEPDTSPSVAAIMEQALDPGSAEEAAALSRQVERSPAPDDQQSSDDLLAEARVSLDFGNLEEAERCTEQVLSREAHSDAARAILAEIRGKQGNVQQAIQIQQERHELAAALGDAELLAEIEVTLRDLRGTGVPGTPPPPPASAPSPGESQSDESLPNIELVLEDEDDQDPAYASVDPPTDLEPAGIPDDIEIELDDPETLETVPRPAQGESLTGSRSDSALIAERVQEGESHLAQGDLDAAEKLLREVLQRVPQHPQALLRLGEIAHRRGDASERAGAGRSMEDTAVEPQDDDEIPSIPELMLDELEEPTGSGLELTPDPSGVLPEEDELAELEPEEPLAEVTAAATPDEELDLDLDLDLEGEAPEAEAEADEDEEGGDFDLAAELGADQTGDEATEQSPLDEGFEQVFHAFKKGIQEQIGDEECDAHYDLAIAYKEMGLLDDALEELEIVYRGGRALEAASLMAECKLALDRPEEAVHHLHGALKLPEAKGPGAIPLLYDLGVALLASGRNKNALTAFNKVSQADPGFRDVADRITEIQKIES